MSFPRLRHLASLALSLSLLQAGHPVAAAPPGVEAFLAAVPAEFPPAALQRVFEVGTVTPSDLQALELELRKRQDLAASLERLDETFREHRLALSDAESRLIPVRPVPYRSPILLVTANLATRIPELANAPALGALRAAGQELARRYVPRTAIPAAIDRLLATAPNLSAAQFLQNARPFLDPALLSLPAFKSLTLERRADLTRNILAGSLAGDAALAFHFLQAPSVDKLVRFASGALEVHAGLEVQEAASLGVVRDTLAERRDALDEIYDRLDQKRDEVEAQGHRLRDMKDIEPKLLAAYSQGAEDLLRAQEFMDALSAGNLPGLALGAGMDALAAQLPKELVPVGDTIRKIAGAPSQVGAEIEKLLAASRDAMGYLDGMVKSNSLSLELTVGSTRLDATKLVQGVFSSSFEAAVATSGLTVDLGGGSVNVASLVGGLASGDLLSAVTGSGLTLEIGGGSVNVANVAANIATGNFLGALGGLFGGGGGGFGGLFGGGGGQSAAQLAAIRQQLEQIQRTLDRIVQDLQRIEKKLDQLREEFRQAHLDVMAKLSDLQLDLTALREASLATFQQQAASCFVLNDLRGKTYEQVRQIVNDRLFKQFGACHDYVLEKGGLPRVPVELTVLLNAEGESPQLDIAARQRRERYESYVVAHMQLFEDNYRLPERRRASAVLLDARPTLGSLRERLQRLKQGGVPPEPDSADAVLPSAFAAREVVEVAPLEKFVGHIFTVQELDPFYNARTRRIVTADCVRRGKSCVGSEAYASRVVTEKRLHGALRLVNTALVQQELLSGDLLLPVAAGLIGDGKLDSPRGRVLATVLEGNPVLTSNLLHYLLDKRMEVSGHRARATQYALARAFAKSSTAGNDDDMLFIRQLFESGAPRLVFFESRPDERSKLAPNERSQLEADLRQRCRERLPAAEGTHAVLPGGHCVPLPSPQTFTTGELETTPDWQKAARLRQQLLDELTGYSFRAGLSPADRRLYTSLLLLEARTP